MKSKENFLERFLGGQGQIFFGKFLPELIEKVVEEQKEVKTGVEMFLKHNYNPAADADGTRRW